MEKKNIVANVPVKPILKLEITYQRNTIIIATIVVASGGIGTNQFIAVMNIKAINGGSTICIRNIIHCEAHPALCPKAFVVQMSTDDAKGSIAVSSAKASPTGISNMARIGNTIAPPAPVTENQYGASASQPPITAPAAMDTI